MTHLYRILMPKVLFDIFLGVECKNMIAIKLHNVLEDSKPLEFTNKQEIHVFELITSILILWSSFSWNDFGVPYCIYYCSYH